MAITNTIHPPHIPTTTFLTIWQLSPHNQIHFRLCCCSDSKPKRGFGTQQYSNKKDPKEKKIASPTGVKGAVSRQRKSTSQQSGTASSQAPRLRSGTDRKSNNISLDFQFEQRLEATKRSVLDQRKLGEIEEFGAIEYDVTVESEPSVVGLGTKIGVGVVVIVFGLIFALGDLFPLESEISPIEDEIITKMSEGDKVNLKRRLIQFAETRKISPEDSSALEGKAVPLSELGDYTQAAFVLEDIIKKRPSDTDALRLLGEIRFELKDYEGSAAAYKSSAMKSKSVNFEVLRGLTNALLAAKKPDEAVQILLVLRERLNTEKSSSGSIDIDNRATEALLDVDPIQVELLLGKAYTDWGHVSDAVSVYDQLITNHPDDFRGYLAKGVIMKESGNVGAAERMFIQARFFAPDKAKIFVDRYSRQ